MEEQEEKEGEKGLREKNGAKLKEEGEPGPSHKTKVPLGNGGQGEKKARRGADHQKDGSKAAHKRGQDLDMEALLEMDIITVRIIEYFPVGNFAN